MLGIELHPASNSTWRKKLECSFSRFRSPFSRQWLSVSYTVQFAFMSTTTNRAVALKYANEGGGTA